MLTEFKGKNGSIILYKDKIVIKRGILHPNGRNEKEIYLNKITAIQIKKPGLVSGYIQFIIPGSNEIKSIDIMDYAYDENSVTFGKSKYEDALELKKKIEQFKEQIYQTQHTCASGAISIADELTKLKNLLDSGVLTEEEFMREKARLLNR